jgi:hypothetical protein
MNLVERGQLKLAVPCDKRRQEPMQGPHEMVLSGTSVLN